jgi:ketosteroid isomerase-like protein
MSKENKEIVRRGYELFAAGDLDGVAALFAPDAELFGELGRTGFSEDDSAGPQRFLRAVAHAREYFDDYQIKTGQFLDGDEVVVVGLRITYVRRDTGKKHKARRGHLWRLRDGMIVHGSAYDSIDVAVVKAGGGYDPGAPPPGKFGDYECFGRLETSFNLEDVELELPAGEVLVSIVNYNETNKLRVELEGPYGPVEMTPTSPRGFDADSTNSKWTRSDIARGDVSAPGRHTLRVTGFEAESARPRTIIVGRGVTAMERLEKIPGLGRLMRRG